MADAKENKEREKALEEKERAALKERDNCILAEMKPLERNLDVESKQPFINNLMKWSMTMLSPWMMNTLVEEILYLNTPRATVGGKRPRDFSQSQPQLSPRPAVGGKKA
ncbi:unnamed protein product [Pocillopora meandrina]|uniref:Uncharacterized protein n=1 Tax=Pocillopora meandrina TaxID=46732 RepID=A0AAU9VVB8_9CNID|nr:unnamed protein product [Pocillopora meandrina]